jgi:two-component system sensor histidine kinase/response regulator
VIALLEESGAQVRIAENGLEALAAVKLKFPDIVLMDIHMPMMDGYQATAAIRALGAQGRDLPILATTADALEGDRDRALRAGMNDHLVKPLEPADLMRALYRWTRVGRQEPALVSNLISVKETAMSADSMLLDRDEGVRNCLGRPALFAQGLKIFIDVYGPTAQKLSAMRLDDPKPDDPDFPRLVHTLKGSVRSLGMLRLADTAVAIDTALRTQDKPAPEQLERLLVVLEETLTVARALQASLKAEAPAAKS